MKKSPIFINYDYRRRIQNIDNNVYHANKEQKEKEPVITIENNEDKIKNLKKLLNEKENELERSKKESSRYYKLYLEYKESKKVDFMNLENRNKELI